MNNNIKAFHCCGYASIWMVMAGVKNVVLHKLGLKMSVLVCALVRTSSK